jgi:hypothetical protein
MLASLREGDSACDVASWKLLRKTPRIKPGLSVSFPGRSERHQHLGSLLPYWALAAGIPVG